MSEVVMTAKGKAMKYSDAANNMAEFWDDEGTEQLVHTTIDDAVEAILDASGETAGTLVVHGWRRREVDEAMRERLAGRALESLLYEMDCNEELGDPDGEYHTARTDGMKAAARDFVDAVAAGYDVWACEAVLAVEVDIAEWVKENAPHWLDEEG